MKILIITPRIPYPPYRGDKLKIYNLCKILRKNNNVHIITFITKPSEKKDLISLKEEGFLVEAITHSKFRSYLNFFKVLFSSSPFQVLYYHSNKMRKRIKAITSESKYDIVYFHLINSAQYYNAISNRNTLKVIDFTDATSLYLTKYLEFLNNPLRKLFFNIELKKVLKYEKIVENFDTLFVCSPVDKQFLLERNIHRNIQLLVNGFDLETFKYEKVEKEKGKIIFVGNMTYFPNIDAVIYFSREILPLIIGKIPSVKFYIVGQNPTQDVMKLQSDNIIVKGFVEDLKIEYLSSEVNIAPIRFGSGTLNKLIEAIALGVPSIASSLATQGFSSELKKYIQIINDPKDFAEKIISILNNPKEDENLITGRNVISEMLSWEKIVSDFENYLQNRI